MSRYLHSRLVKKGKKLGIIFIVQVKGIPMYRRVNLRFSPCLFNLFSVFLFHNKSIFNIYRNCDFGAVSSPLQGQVLLRCRNSFRGPQEITCSEQGFRKSVLQTDWSYTKKTARNCFHRVRKYFDFKD